MSLLGLPNELIQYISYLLDDEYCINAFLQTCKRLFWLLNYSLYEHNVRFSHACSLEWAAKNGYESAARLALQAGASPNARFYEEWLPMGLACIHGHVDVVTLLLANGVDPDTPYGWYYLDESSYEPEGGVDGCPMIVAAGGGHESIVRLLVSHGASPDIRFDHTTGSRDGFAALNVATEGGHLSVVKYLLEVGCDINISGWCGDSILSDAAQRNHVALVKFLLQIKPDIESPPSSALDCAAGQGHLEVVDIILNHWAVHMPSIDISLDPMIAATRFRHKAVVARLQMSMNLEQMVSHGDIDDDDHKHLFLLSVTWGWKNLIQSLLDRGCPVVFDSSDLHYFPFRLQRDNNGIGLSKTLANTSPLDLAAHEGHHDIVKLLLNHIANMGDCIATREIREASPLFLAIDGAHHDIVQMLLANGADPNNQIESFNYREPIFFHAAETPEILRTLLDSGADVTLRSSDSETILIKALKTGSVGALDVLKIWMPIEEPVNSTSTPCMSLFQAATIGGAAAMEYLLDEGYHILPGSSVVKKALKNILPRSDTKSLKLLLERGLVEPVSAFSGGGLIADVDSPTKDSVAVAATLDMLLAHGFEINGTKKSPLATILTRKHPFNSKALDLTVHFQILLERGADPLREDSYNLEMLTELVDMGRKDLLRIVFQSLEHREIPLDFLEQTLHYAEGAADELESQDAIALLRRFFWRKKNQMS